MFCCLLVSSIIVRQRRADLPPLVREEEEMADCPSPLRNGYSVGFESRKWLQIVC